MTTWDSSFEATPADTDEAKYGANEIRTLKTALSERLDTELNFKTGGQPLLKAGIAAVCFSGNQTQIANLANEANSNVANGALAYDSENFVLQQYWGGAWANMVIYHNQLGNLANGDPHTQYLKLDKANQTISANILLDPGVTIGGVDIANVTAHAFGELTRNPFGAGNLTYHVNYTATEDAIIVANGVCASIGVKTPSDSANCQALQAAASNAYSLTVTCPVAKGETFRIVCTSVSGDVQIWYMPIGS